MTDEAPPPPPVSTDAAPPIATDRPDRLDRVTITGTTRSPELDAPLSGAIVTVEGTGIMAKTDASGHFQLAVPPGRVTLHATFDGFRSFSREIRAESGKPLDVDIPLGLDQLLTEVVVVVGSRTPRTNVETPVPVDVVTAEDLAQVGRTQTARLLTTLAPSYVSNSTTVNDGTDHVDAASLRGLGPDQVLVLVNGKRRHKSALLNVNQTFGRGNVATDLNAIPAGSIKRIEILRDGASAQYGSDAIAGVINIVTRDDADTFDLTTLTGLTGSRDGAQVKTSAGYGFRIGKKGVLHLTGEFLQKARTDRAGDYTGPVYSSDPATDQMILDARNKRKSDFKMRIGEAATTDALAAYTLEIPINANASFYSSGDLSRRNGSSAGFYRFPAAENQSVPEFFPDGFLPEIHSNLMDLGVTIGVHHKGDWVVDASLTHGQSAFRFNVENSVNASWGTASPTSFDAGTLSASETVGDLDLIRKIDTDLVKSLAFVVGTEVRLENYQITAGDVASYDFRDPAHGGAMTSTGAPKIPGAQVFPGFQPANEVDRGRNNVGVYAGIESEIVKGLNFDLSGRYENYSDFGQSITGKGAVRIPLGKMLALRAAVSTGFRAPSLQQLWFSNIATLLPNQVLTSNNESPVTKAFGIPKLTEERSLNASGGLALRPVDNLSLTVDGYFIRIKNRIVLTSFFPAMDPAVGPILAPFPGVTRAQFFSNAIDSDTQGLDAVADYAVRTGGGTLVVSAAANFTRTQVTDVRIPPSLQDRFRELGGDPALLQTYFFGRLARNRIEDSLPHQRGTASVRYTFRGWSALVRGNYYGRIRYKSDPAGGAYNDELFRAKTLFDVSLGIPLARRAQLTLGADNVFNTFPDKQKDPANINLGRFIYSRFVTQFGMNGGFYFGKLELLFD
ncbi:MAG: TonB-dependent receptor [Deltaproteobacteria bacterium]|nr:MAG: TonB-dependent receptor [Deltaproteobacteria bacterium]